MPISVPLSSAAGAFTVGNNAASVWRVVYARLSPKSVTPMTSAEVSAPTRMATCCFHGVAPTRKPVFKSCDVVPPLDDAMQTTPAIESAVKRNSGPTQPSRTKIRQTSSSVAIVMPEMGFDDEPITPVIRELTVTNKEPEQDNHHGAHQAAHEVSGYEDRTMR